MTFKFEGEVPDGYELEIALRPIAQAAADVETIDTDGEEIDGYDNEKSGEYPSIRKCAAVATMPRRRSA
jgi:hypothetical protein